MFLAVLITVAFAILRFVVPVSGGINQADVFKDLAHVWVGFLFGAALMLSAVRVMYMAESADQFIKSVSQIRASSWWVLAIGLTTIEVIAFFVRRA